MAKLVHAKWPELERYWNEYFDETRTFDKCDGIKIRADGHYIVVRWINEEAKAEGNPDHVMIADLYKIWGEIPVGWEMLNDGFPVMNEKQWKGLRIDEFCDTFTVPDGGEWDSKVD